MMSTRELSLAGLVNRRESHAMAKDVAILYLHALF